MLVKDAMEPRYVAIGPEEKLWDAATKMMTTHNDTLLVMEEGRLIGILGMRDLFTAPKVAYAGIGMSRHQNVDQMTNIWKNTPVRTVMNEEVLSVSDMTPLLKAIELMTNYGKHLLPVLCKGKLLGTISRTDVVCRLLSDSS